MNLSRFKPKSGFILIHAGIILAILIGLYFFFVQLVMPLYTRHWQKIEVPDVDHMSYRAAKKILARSNLQTVRAEEKYDYTAPPGFVIFQNPPPGRMVKKNRRVYLTISKGYQKVEMPKMVGVPERDARFTLHKQHLEIGQVDYAFNSFYPEGVVFEQSIEPDSEIEANTKINLTVSLGNEPGQARVPDLIGKKKQQAILALKRINLVLGEVSFQSTSVFPENTVISQSIEPGTEVSKRDTVNIVLSRQKDKVREGISW